MGPNGANLHDFRHNYRCNITVSPRGNLHATDIIGRTVIFCAPQRQLVDLFDDLFQHIVNKFVLQYPAQFMVVLPSAQAGHILGIEGSRIRLWQHDYALQLEIRDSAEVSERLLVAAGTISAHTSFTPAFLSVVGCDWSYAVGFGYVTAPGTKRRYAPASHGDPLAKRKRQMAQAAPSAWQGRHLQGSSNRRDERTTGELPPYPTAVRRRRRRCHCGGGRRAAGAQ